MIRKLGDKEFTLVDRFPAKQFNALLKRMMVDANQFVELPLSEQVKPYLGTIIAWPFAGDPLSQAAWENLDIFDELPLAFRVVNELAGERIEKLDQNAKN